MKRLAIITASLLTVFSGWNLSAQTSKYGHGEDSLNCLKYLSFYTERFKKDEKAFQLASGLQVLPCYRF